MDAYKKMRRGQAVIPEWPQREGLTAYCFTFKQQIETSVRT
jgi:hypothetical protein